MAEKKIVPLLIIIIITVLLCLPLLINPALRTRSDALLHVSITNSILRSGIPPRNPFVAGENIHYYWFYHALVALLTGLTNIEPSQMMALLNPVGLFLLLGTTYLIVVFLSRPRLRYRNALLGVFLVAFGLNGWGWLLLVRRALSGGVSSLKPVLTRGVWGFLPHIVYERLGGKMGFFGRKYLSANAFPLCLACMIISLYALLKFFRRPKPLPAIIFIIFATLSAYLNLIAGVMYLVLCGAFFSIWLLLYLAGRHREIKISLFGFLFLFISFLLLLPYLRSVLSGIPVFQRALYLRPPDWIEFRTPLLITLPLWLLCLLTAGRPQKGRMDPERIMLIVSILFLIPAILLIRLPRHNEYILVFLLAVFLALFIAGRAPRLSSRAGITAWLITLSLIPTTIFGLIAYSHDPFEISLSPREAALYEWIAARTPKNAVVLSERKVHLIPMLARRDTFWACEKLLRNNANYDPEVADRRKPLLSRFWRSPIRAPILERMEAEVGRPIYFITYGGKKIEEEGIFKAYNVEDLSLWGWKNSSSGP